MPPERHSSIREIRAYLDYVDRLLIDDPQAGREASEALPRLVAHIDRDTRAHAYSTVGLAHLKAGEEQGAESAFQEARSIAQTSRAGIRALVELRAAALHVLNLDYSSAERELFAALSLAQRDPLGAIPARVYMHLGYVAFSSGKFANAVERYGLALNSMPRKEEFSHLRAICAWNLLITVYNLDRRSASSMLRLLQRLGLKCRKSRAKVYQRPSVSRCTICWAEGYLRCLLGQQALGADCLSWAARNLSELGALREAVQCALDLLSFDPDVTQEILPFVRALASAPETSKTLRQAALTWVATPEANSTRSLRTLLVSHHPHVGRVVDSRGPDSQKST